MFSAPSLPNDYHLELYTTEEGNSVIFCSRLTIFAFSRSGIVSPLLPPLASVLLKADM